MVREVLILVLLMVLATMLQNILRFMLKQKKIVLLLQRQYTPRYP